jgi:hypothetical protein
VSQKYGEPGASARAVAERLRCEATRLDAQAGNWEQGVLGEVATAAALEALPAEFVVLHDLSVPGSESNVDHVVVGPTGVWVIDSKEWTGRITNGNNMLWRGQTPLRDELRTATWLARVVQNVGKSKARAVLCFGGVSLPASQQEVERVLVVGRDALVSHIAGAPVTLSPKQIEKTVERLRRGMDWKEVATAMVTESTTRAPRRRRETLAWPILRLLAIGVAAIVVVPIAARLATGPASDAVTRSLEGTGTRSSRSVPPTTGATTTTSAAPTTTVAAPVLPVDAVLAATFGCFGPGQGWTLLWAWPGPVLPAGQAYLYEWKAAEQWVPSGRTAAPDDGGAVALGNIGPGESYAARLSVVEGVPERSSSYVETVLVAPSEAC